MADNEHHLSREEKIEQWIFEEGIKKENRRAQRKKVIPSSTDSITHTPVGNALDAMEKVAFYLGDHPELPIVDMGSLQEDEIVLSFSEPQELGYPFRLESDVDATHWIISHQDALSLDTGTTYGWQTAALTAIGNSPEGGKMLLNTNRWQVLGLGGLDQFIEAVMVGQVMEHATEPWTVEHHIWLVGYRDLGPKLVNFLTMYHDRSYFHLVESAEQITADDIEGTTATLYVKNSNAATLEAFERLHAAHPNRVGMLTDSIVTEQAMYISENENGTAAIVNAGPQSINFYPNIIDQNHKLYLAMEVTWERSEQDAEKARQAVESLTVEDFLPATPEPAQAEPERTGSTSISVEDLEALWNGGTAERDTPPQAPAAETAPAEPETETVTVPAPTETAPAEPETEPTPEAEPTPTPANPVAVEPVAAHAPLSLLGSPELHGADGSLVEKKPAEAVAYLHFNGLTGDGVDVSQALWPDTENEGNTARTRRARAVRTIREALPETFRVDEGQWIIDPLTTDLDQTLAALAGQGNPEDAVRACEAIKAPLQGCAAWADEPRAQIVSQLREALESAMDRALDNDQLEIVKAIRQATKKL